METTACQRCHKRYQRAPECPQGATSLEIRAGYWWCWLVDLKHPDNDGYAGIPGVLQQEKRFMVPDSGPCSGAGVASPKAIYVIP